MKKPTYPDLVLGVSLTARGMGYVILEGPQAPFDWGVTSKGASARFAHFTGKVKSLIDTCQPVVMVLEDFRGRTSLHSPALRRLSRRLGHLAESKGLTVAHFDRTAIRTAFAPLGAKTKPEIAEAISAAIPAFSHRKPPVRKIWMSEDRRQLLFDAAALGITWYGNRET